MTSITSLLKENHVFVNLKAASKEEALNALVDSLENDLDGEEVKTIRNAIFERENIMSTGVGKGLAIPHGKAPGITDNYAAFAVLEEPIEYDAIDNNPVDLIFLLAGPKSSNSLHIKMLSRISRLMNTNSFREKLKACSSAGEILQVFEEEEEVHFDN